MGGPGPNIGPLLTSQIIIHDMVKGRANAYCLRQPLCHTGVVVWTVYQRIQEYP